MRLLILLPLAPRQDATNGGARVLTQFLMEITVRHRVAILYFREADEPGADLFFHERCERVEEIVRPASRKSLLARVTRYFRMILSLFLLRPVWVSDWASLEFAKRARLLAQTFQPEVIQSELHVMGQYLSALRDVNARRVLVEYESSARAALYLQNLPWALRDLVEAIEKISWQRYERNIYRQVDAIVAFTPADQKAISQTAGRTPIYIISPGTRIPEYPLDPLGSSPPNLLFTGSFYHPPNADAARRLIDSIFPSVRRRLPNTRLFVVGENPPASLDQSNRENIIITGRVPDITPYLDQAALVVAPLRLGGGMRIKVLESLVAGKAVVTTSLAAEGLDIQDGEQLALAETDDEFVSRIVELLQNPEKRIAIAQRARAWACENIAWPQSVAKYETLYQGLLTSQAPSG
ncbi:MAG TPA: glycosyltransferase family 4 protein [Anaerolineales bacterium]|nr:glycosyltransferase family 4 protein [Anaerolineales bacterium]